MLDDQFAHLVNDTAKCSWNRVRQQTSGKLFMATCIFCLPNILQSLRQAWEHIGPQCGTSWRVVQLYLHDLDLCQPYTLALELFSCYVIGARGLYQLTLLWSVCRGLKNEMKLEMECKNFLLERGCLLFLSSLLSNVISIALTYLIGSLKWETKKLIWSRNKKWRL